MSNAQFNVFRHAYLTESLVFPRWRPLSKVLCKTQTFHESKFVSKASSSCFSAKPDFQSVFSQKFVVWNLILCNLCHSNSCCDWYMRERAYSFDLHNGKHNFSFLERLKWPVMKWAERHFEKQRQLLVLLTSRCISLATSSDRMMTGLVKLRKWKNIADENTSSFSDAIWKSGS